jgi:hypothetical protein
VVGSSVTWWVPIHYILVIAVGPGPILVICIGCFLYKGLAAMGRSVELTHNMLDDWHIEYVAY